MDRHQPNHPLPYPGNDSPLTLSSGMVVRQRNLIVFRGRNVSGLTVTIETPTPASDSERARRESGEVARLHAPFADAQGIGRITVEICRSQACLEHLEAPTEVYHCMRGADGTWVADHSI